MLGGRSATSSANMSSNSRNVKSPFLTTTCQYWGGGLDLPLHLPIWALTVEMWNRHWNCHSDALADLPGVDLPILNTLYVSCFASQKVLSFIRKTNYFGYGTHVFRVTTFYLRFASSDDPWGTRDTLETTTSFYKLLPLCPIMRTLHLW